ncbi:MAG: S8 family serine peptidase, partial [Acidobacteria bacterium]|nr:S8 family serine peptidase [Acidobacteriota bacterium]
MIHLEVRGRRPLKGHLFKGILVLAAFSALAVTTGWAGRAEVRSRQGGTEDLLSTSIMPAPRQPVPSGGRVDLPVLYERGLKPLFPAWPAVNRRALFSSAEHLPTVNGVIDLRRPLPGSLGAGLSRAFGDRGATLLVVTDGLPGEKVSRALGTGGGRLVAPFGPNAWIVQANDARALSGLASHPGVLSVLPFGPELIVDRRIGQIPVISQEEARRSDLPLRAGVLPGSDPEAVAADLSAFGATISGIQQAPSAFPVIRFRMPYDLILTAAEQVSGLFRIEEETAVMVAGEEIAASMQSGGFFNGRVPLWDAGVDGGGGSFSTPQIVAVTDTGLSYDATHFADTVAVAGVPGPLHSKLESYLAVGGGDLLSCDNPANGGSTHGNVVAGVLAGNVTRFGIDLRNNPGWESAFTEFAADGVARGARVVFQDAQAAAACTSDFDLVTPGNLFDRLTEARSLGARVHNLSFSESGSEGVYTLESMNVDQFLRSNREYLAVVAAGNNGSDADGDGNYEFGSITAPGTAKNALTAGASNFPNEPINPFDTALALTPGVPNEGINLLAIFSTGSTGRGPATFPNRVKPDVMAPGQDIFPNLRVDGAAACASSDNDNDEATGGIECILDDDNDGTSFAAAGVAGAGVLVRDYFAQGFGDDGGPGGPEVGRSVSGAAVKAVLLGSAEMMEVSPAFRLDLVQPRFDIPDLHGRFNFEQGYGRVNLSKILPLNTSAGTPRGLFLEDQGVSGGLLQGETYSRTFTALNPDEELRIALAWMDVPDLSGNGALLNDLDLEVIDHGVDNILGNSDDVRYHGNFFTEDQGNFDGRLQLFDPNFPGIEGEDSDGDGVLDESAFSLPVTLSLRDYRDDQNPNEVVMLSPDPNRDGDDLDRQVFPGRQYTVNVLARRVLSPFETIITAGANVVLDSTPSGDDQVSGDTIHAGPDGVAQT